MKKNLLKLLFITAILLLGACDDMENKTSPENPITDSRLFVLCEGLANWNNSTLAMIENGAITPDFFTYENKRGLGDTANDIKRYGNKIYIVVSGSSTVEVIDHHTGKSLKQISLLDEKNLARQPRYITFYNENAYVCSFDGTVARIDTASLEVTGTVLCGRNPDGICVARQKLYVSNSGGLDFPGYDNTVSVIDLESFTELKKIETGINPSTIMADSRDNVYVVSRGNYGTNPYMFQKINTEIDVVEQTFDEIQALNFTIHNDTAYLYNYDYSQKSFWIKTFDCNSGVIISENFITDDTKITTPYSITINPTNGDVYVTDAKGYIIKGDVFCFDRNGKKKFVISEIGINPNKVIFVD